MKIFSILVLVFSLCAGARSEEGLVEAFAAARAASVKSRVVPVSHDRPATPVRAASARFASISFVPEGCTVQSWCLVKATECFLGFTSNPGGLWQGHAQYSVVRRATAYCPVGYGKWETRTFMSGVEPQPFTSAIETDKDEAGASALRLCKAYRADWLDAAPACGN